MGLMKTYGYYLILHILGLTGLIAAGVLAMLHGLWFCTIICGLLLIGICYSLYRIQIRQTETMYRLVECMKQNDLGQRVCAPFADPQMQKLAEDLSQALKNLRTRIVDEEEYREMEVFTQFASDLDDATKAQLQHGKALMELLKQPLCHPLSMHEQVMTLVMANNGVFDEIPTKEVKKHQTELLEFIDLKHPEIGKQIEDKKEINDELVKNILEAVKEFA